MCAVEGISLDPRENRRRAFEFRKAEHERVAHALDGGGGGDGVSFGLRVKRPGEPSGAPLIVTLPPPPPAPG